MENNANNTSNKKPNYKDMFLESPSGFSMPFELKDEEELHVILPYGEQTHPKTGEKFNHLGVDLAVKDKELWALASGSIIGAGENAIHGNYIVVKYGKYEVTYGHISEAYTPYGTTVSAGDTIARAGDFLHLGVRFAGRDMDPMEFLKVIWGNIQQLAVMGIHGKKGDDNVQGRNIHTQYDAHQDEILMLMLRWLPEYMNELRNGSYAPSLGTESTLRNIFAQAARKDYFYEAIPSIANPLGFGGRAVPLIEKVQNLLIQDFLSYMFTRHSRVMPEMDENEKKKFLREQPKTE